MMRFVLVASVVLYAGQGAATTWGLEERGRAIAEENCARCHAIGATDASTHSVAPPFRDLAARWPLEQLEEALAEGLVTGHPDMPEFIFKPDDIDALLAFMASISK